MDDRGRLEDWVAEELRRPVHPAVPAVAELVRARHGATTAGILFYGSCLHQPAAAAAPPEGVLDFYLLVDSYRDAYRGRLLALANAALPPNVFHVQAPWRGRIVRAKYAVVSLAQFRHGTSPHSFPSSLWARFAQPSRLVFARDPQARAAIVAAVARAVVTMVMRVAPLLEDDFGAEQLWLRGFTETYRAELRTEDRQRARLIYLTSRQRYDRITPWALRVAGVIAHGTDPDGRFRLSHAARAGRRSAHRRWAARRVLGKLLSVLRLIKGLFTFDGGVDYVFWKIERHTGVRVPISPWQRRHPLLASPVFLWRLFRLGAIR